MDIYANSSIGKFYQCLCYVLVGLCRNRYCFRYCNSQADKAVNPICRTHINCKFSISYVFIHASYALYCTFRVDRYVFYMYISAGLILLSPNREWFSVQEQKLNCHIITHLRHDMAIIFVDIYLYLLTMIRRYDICNSISYVLNYSCPFG